jgi:hypothetical protein
MHATTVACMHTAKVARETNANLGEFDAAMLRHGAASNMEVARLLGCGESTVSRIRGQRINISDEVRDLIVAEFDEATARRIVRETVDAA